MTGYWLVTLYFARVLANLKLFLEILLLTKVITNINGCFPILSHLRNVIEMSSDWILGGTSSHFNCDCNQCIIFCHS